MRRSRVAKEERGEPGFAGIMSHGPASPAARSAPIPQFASRSTRSSAGCASALERRPDALIVIAAEHFANFFMNNMPAYAIGMADDYEGPIEDPGWLGIARTRFPATPISRGA